jgi:hypothetical protein
VPVEKLTDEQWGWIIAAAIFAWLQARCQHAMAEGLAAEELILHMDPPPRESAAVLAVLPKLSEFPIDWTRPLMDWSRDEMTAFLQAALRLIDAARGALGPEAILQTPDEGRADDCPF